MTGAGPAASVSERGRWLRVGRAVVGAFSGATIASVAVAMFTSGDFLSVTDPRRLAPIALALAAGAYLAQRARTRRAQIALCVVAALCALYWVAAPSGWWASPPPPRHP